MEGRYLRAVAAGLRAHGIVGNESDVTPQSLETHIVAFQEKAGLLVDGVIGPQTIWALQYDPVMDGPKYELINVSADRPQGYRSRDYLSGFRMREDAASVLEQVAQELRAAGGILTSSGGLRPLSEGASQDRSAMSFHYTGLALDIAINTGTFDLQRSPYLCEYNVETAKWQVWAKAEGGEEREIQAVIHTGAWDRIAATVTPIRAKVIDLTALFATNGFVAIRARPGYRSAANGSKRYLSSEWWHFQYESPLTPQFSMFGIELLKVKGYDSAWHGVRRAMQPNGIWRHRMAIFKNGWS